MTARRGYDVPYVLEAVVQDLKFGIRILVRSPAMTLAVIVALALGIGANSAMFSVVDALLLNPLRYAEPARLAVVWDKDAQAVVWSASPANFLDWRKQSRMFEEFAGWSPTSYVRTGVDRPEQYSGATVTANFFHLLGVKPALGRTFLAEDDGIEPPGPPRKVAVISDRMWRENLGANPNVLGMQLKLNSANYTIIGVMPASFQFISRPHQVWTPMAVNKQNRDFHSVTVVARLAKGATLERASAEMAVIAGRLAEAYPKSNKGWSIEADDFQEWLVNRSFKTRLLLLFAAVGLVLLIACTNVATLLLARSSGRSREIAVRLSLGATSGRVVCQLLTESVLLSVVGGVAGLGLAWELIRLAPRFVPPNAIPAAAPIVLNAAVVVFTLAISIVTGILFGLAPALAVTKPDVQETLKDSTRGTTGGRGRQRFRQVMVAAEVAFALMLVASAVLMIESLRALTSTELGFNAKNAMSLRLFLPPAKYDAVAALRFHRRVLTRLSALPGVTSVALGTNLPLQRVTMGAPFDLETSVAKVQAEMPDINYVTVSPEYFSALGIVLKRGRAFQETDNETSPPVAIVNQAFADRYFPGEIAVGKRILLDRPKLPSGFEDTIHPEIVGIVANVKTGDLAAPSDAILYSPHAQNVWSPAVFFMIRSTTDPTGLTAAIRRELLAIDPEQPISQVGSLETTLMTRSAEPRFQTQMMSTFAGLALLLAVVGIYGVNAYAVSQRRHEIGVRMALGATPGIVLREMIGQGMKLTAVGIAIGISGALAIASLLKSVLVGVSATDPVTLGGVAIMMAVVAALACYIPAKRATRIDPAIALRGE
jgi:putative ABC transport system permease protein